MLFLPIFFKLWHQLLKFFLHPQKPFLNFSKVQNRSAVFSKKNFFAHPLLFALNDNSSGRLLYNANNSNTAIATQELESLQNFPVIFRTWTKNFYFILNMFYLNLNFFFITPISLSFFGHALNWKIGTPYVKLNFTQWSLWLNQALYSPDLDKILKQYAFLRLSILLFTDFRITSGIAQYSQKAHLFCVGLQPLTSTTSYLSASFLVWTISYQIRLFFLLFFLFVYNLNYAFTMLYLK